MSASALFVLKYISLLLTLGTAFAGSWLFEFTTTDKETGKRKLTLWGRRGIFFASLSLVCAVAASISSDIASGREKAAAEVRANASAANANAERLEAAKFRKDLMLSQNNIGDLLSLIARNARSLPQDARRDTMETVDSLTGVDAIREKFPEIFSRMQQALTFDEVKAAATEAMTLQIEDRVSKDSRCEGINLTTHADTPVRTGHEIISTNPTRSIRYLVSSDGVSLEYMDMGANGALDQGYVLRFSDGTESPVMMCKEFHSLWSCRDSAAIQSIRLIFNDIKLKGLSSIKYGSFNIAISPEISSNIKSTFSCITP